MEGPSMPREHTREPAPRSPLSPEQQRTVMRVADAALDAAPEARPALVERMCADDPLVRLETLRFLVSCTVAEYDVAFLAESAAEFAAPVLAEIANHEDDLEPDLLAELREALAPRYSVERELAHGGMATVFVARDERHQRQVVIKIVHAHLTHRVGVARFLREITLASTLRHPHIVPLYDSGEVNGRPFYVMPHIEGGSLAKRLRREGQLQIADAVAVARDVAEALDHAHARGIVHRDIKPQNILLDGSHVLVADFGIARAIEAVGVDRLVDRLTESGVAIGTPPYMSPEQAEGEDKLDARSDVYALACVVYEMLTGEPPYAGSTRHVVLAKHAFAPIPKAKVMRPTIPDEAQSVLERALAKVPADRYASAGEFVRELGAALSPTSPTPSRRFGRIVASLTLAAAVTGTILVIRPEAAPTPLAPAIASAGALDPKRIAVLYLDDLSPDKTLGHVAAGLTEDLIDELNQVRGLRVISPNGVRPFRGSTARVDSISHALDVGTLVAGSVNSSGRVLRVTVRLISAPGGEQLQSRTLDSSRDDLLALQDSLTEEVALFLRDRLGQEIRLRRLHAEATSQKAWENVQRADELAQQGSALVLAREARAATAALLRADSLFLAAEAEDPSWGVPTVGRGRVALSLALVSPGPEQPLDTSASGTSRPRRGLSAPWIYRGVDHANRALERNPGASEALALRGELRHRLANYAESPNADELLRLAESDLRQALDTRPDLARGWFALAELYYADARYADALQAARAAFEADAFLTEIRAVVNLLFFSALHVGRMDEARSWCTLATQRYVEYPRFVECELMQLGWTGRSRDDIAAAWKQIDEIEQRGLPALAPGWSYRRLMAAAVIARAGMRDSAVAVIRRTSSEQARHPRSRPMCGCCLETATPPYACSPVTSTNFPEFASTSRAAPGTGTFTRTRGTRS